MLLLTGLRQGELLGLRWMDIDFTSKLTRKSHVVYRHSTNSPNILCSVGRMAGRWDPDHMRRYVLYPALEAAEITIEKHQNGLHMFRHTVATEMNKRTGDLKLV